MRCLRLAGAPRRDSGCCLIVLSRNIFIAKFAVFPLRHLQRLDTGTRDGVMVRIKLATVCLNNSFHNIFLEEQVSTLGTAKQVIINYLRNSLYYTLFFFIQTYLHFYITWPLPLHWIIKSVIIQLHDVLFKFNHWDFIFTKLYHSRSHTILYVLINY